jgi:hypothetical protein
MSKPLLNAQPYPTGVKLDPKNAFLPDSQCFVVNIYNGQVTPLRPEMFATDATAAAIAAAVGAEVKQPRPSGPYVGTLQNTIVFSDDSTWNAGWAAKQMFLRDGFQQVGGEYVGEDLSFSPPPPALVPNPQTL